MRQIRRSRDYGFSLVEMAIVVVLMSIFLTLGIAAFNAQVGNAAQSSTKRKQETIKDALVAYLRDYKRLPCPEVTAFESGIPTGNESRQTTSNPATLCSSYWGTLPYADLGLSRDIAMDGYDNFFSYFVSNAQAISEPDWTLTTSAGVPGFTVGNPGRYAITENGNFTALSKNLAAVVLISHGSNGLGAFTAKGTRNVQPASGTDERTNAPDIPALPNAPAAWSAPSLVATAPPPPPGFATLIIRDRTDTPAPFDDVVMALRPNDLIMPLIKDGAIKSAEALVQEQLQAVRDAAIAQMLGNLCTPVSNPLSTPVVDPWGSAIFYTRINSTQLTAATAATLATTVAFRVWSFGQDRATNLGTGDDRILTTGLDVTYGQISARIPATACP